MFAIISTKSDISKEASHFLRSSEKSLLLQSKADSRRLQKDGWGSAWISQCAKTESFRNPNPIYLYNWADAAPVNFSSNIFMAHIRDASNPRNLPRKKLISIENTQPFFNDEYIFCHNGTLSIPDDIAENLGHLKKNIKGLNDSETLFWHIIKHVKAYGDVSTAFKMAVDEIKTVWISVKKKYSEKGIEHPYRGINIILAKKNALYAMCLHDTITSQKEAILTKGQPWGDMVYRIKNGSFFISSEPLDNGKWNQIISGDIISVKAESKGLVISRDKI